MTTLKHRAHVLAITPGYVGGKRDHFNQFIRLGLIAAEETEAEESYW